MSSRFIKDTYARILVLAAIILACPSCSDEAPARPAPNDKVDVPEIPATVALDDFCPLFDELRCAGALGCCAMSARPFSSDAECLAASTCTTDIGAVLASPLVASGAVVFDATLAADYLRARATSTSDCSGTNFDSSSLQIFSGTLAEGEDCSANADDIAHKYVCKPGLACRLREDATGAEAHTCAPLAATTGSACSVDDDCKEGVCIANKCAGNATALFCAAAPAPVPAVNFTTVSTSDAPELLRVTAHSKSGSGTENDITLLYRNKTATYSCSITATINAGGTQECVPTQSSTNTSSIDYFYVKYANSSNTDGLRITEIGAINKGTLYVITTFNAYDMAIDCEGCSDLFEENDCNSCWIDSNDHGSCTEMKTKMAASGATWCP